MGEFVVVLTNEQIARRVFGGQVYDGAIVACLRHSGVTELRMFNERHVRRIAGDGLTDTVP